MTHDSPEERAARRRAKRDANADRHVTAMFRGAQRAQALGRPIHYFARIALGVILSSAALALTQYYLRLFDITLTRPQHGTTPLSMDAMLRAPHLAGHSLLTVLVGVSVVVASMSIAWSLYTETVGERVLARRAECRREAMGVSATGEVPQSTRPDRADGPTPGQQQ